MTNKPDMTLNAYLFRKASLCPLKLRYLIQEASEEDNGSGHIYKSESRIMLRRILGMSYPDGKTTDRNYEMAIQQTRDWLKDAETVIFGGLVAWESFRARLPVLIRKGDRLTLLQLHGKLWKPRETTLQVHSLGNRKILEYARESAYKKWILTKLYPNLDVSVRLCFPNPKFRPEINNLYETIAFNNARKEDVESFFIKVDADLAVNEILAGFTSDAIHPFFRGKTFQEQLNWMGGQIEGETHEAPFIITNTCKLCPFRINTVKNGKGCWESHLDNKRKYPGRHVFDLIGYGNDLQASKRNYFQEQVGLPPGVAGFQDLYRHSDRTISIQQRRILQLLLSQGKTLPLHWLKKGLLEKIDQITFPVHFVDFEAATSAIPMERFCPPYKPVLFQFSCHTLHRDGSMDHHQWLDSNRRGFPHEEFIRRLADVPRINCGVIIQYSPFEKQALNSLNRDFSDNRSKDDPLLIRLRKLIDGTDHLKEERFMDMNKLVRDFYYNKEMSHGLGLKQVLYSTIKTSGFLRELYQNPVNFGENQIQIITEEGGEPVNPYLVIQDENEIIDEGSAAMHAWLYTKTPFCGEEKKVRVHSALRRYCSLDSLALAMIFQHWLHLADYYGANEDILIWE